MVIKVTKSFKKSIVTLKEVSMVRRLVVGQTQVVGAVYVERFDAYTQS